MGEFICEDLEGYISVFLPEPAVCMSEDWHAEVIIEPRFK